MKAEINGVVVEGTPEEIARVIKLADTTPRYRYVYIPYYPVYFS